MNKEILKKQHKKSAYDKTIEIAKLLKINEAKHGDFYRLVRDTILNVIVERIIQLDIIKNQLNESFDDINKKSGKS